MATINITLGKDDVLNINTTSSKEDFSKEKDELKSKLHKRLVEYSNNRKHPFWYEVFYDFTENFDEIYPKVRGMDFEEAFVYCVGICTLQDDYYNSPQYFDALNKALSKATFK